MPDLRVPMERVINGYRMCAGYPEDHIDAVPNKTLNDEFTTGHASQYRGQARRKRLRQDSDRVADFLATEIAICFVGATIYRRRPPATSGLTQQRSGSPVRPAMRLSAAISAIPLRLLTDALAIWGTMTAFGSVNSSLVASLASP